MNGRKQPLATTFPDVQHARVYFITTNAWKFAHCHNCHNFPRLIVTILFDRAGHPERKHGRTERDQEVYDKVKRP